MPCNATELVHFRKRIGVKGFNLIFKMSVALHGKSVSALLSSTKERPLGNNMEVVEEDPRVEEEEMETNEGEIDLMDIEIQEKHSDRIVEPKRQFHINYLISKCVQPALGNVKDPASDSSRAIDRLKIILNCLQNDTGM